MSTTHETLPSITLRAGRTFYVDSCPAFSLERRRDILTYYCPLTPAQTDAFARLLDAAPDMLRALEYLLESCELNLQDLEPETCDAIDVARAAIAKAKGVPNHG